MNQNIPSDYQSYIFICVGFISIGYAVLFKSKKSKLKETGISVKGIIYKQTESNSFDSNTTSANTIVTVRFVTENKEWITADINQDFQISYTGQYKNGETVNVYYDKENPYNFYVDTNQSEFLARIFAGILGLIFSMIGLYKLLLH